jgi:hypothetical protein
MYKLTSDDREHQTQIVPVEDEPEQILPDALSENPLLGSPGCEPFKDEAYQGNRDQPEIILGVNRHEIPASERNS